MDMSALKNRLKKLKSGGANPNLWRPQDGKQIIRLVPYRYGDNPLGPFVELYFHYDLEGPNYLSPISFQEGKGIGTQELIDRSDPVAEFAEHQRRSNGDEGFEVYKTLYPTLRIYAPVVVRGEEDKGVRFWGFSKTVYEQLMEYMVDPDWGDLSDAQNGRDIKLTYTTEGVQYPETSIQPKPSQSPLAGSEAELRKLYESQVKITEAFDEIPTEDELESALESWLNSTVEEEEESPTQASQQGELEESDDFDEEYEKMFN